MTRRFDRRHPGRHVGDHTMALQRGDESPAVGLAAAETAEPPAGPFDAPSAHAQSAVLPARAVGLIRWDESIVAITGFSMLAEALRQLGMETETRGCFVWVRPPDRNSQSGPYEVVVLGHHPGDADRLWWLLVMGSFSPVGVSGSLKISTLRAIGPIDEIVTVADYIARDLRARLKANALG